MVNLHPGLLLILFGIIAVMVPKKIRQVILVAGPAVAFLSVFTVPVGTSRFIEIFGGYKLYIIQVTNENYMYLFAFALVALLAGIYSCHNDSKLNAFSSMGYAGGAICTAIAGDWICLLIFWEFIAVMSLFLIWGNKTERSTKAGYRYLIYHMIGGNFLLFGILFKVFSGSLMIENIAGHQDLGYWLIFIGMAINAGVVPLHAWIPDAYPESTITGGAYLSSFTTKLAVLCMMRVFAGEKFLIIVGIIMILYGASFALIENDMRRLLSYHIVSQLGFMVADMGIAGELGVNASAAMGFGNILYKSILFMCAGAVIYATGIRKVNQLGGLFKKMPAIGFSFFVAALSIAGLPPFCGFVGKTTSLIAAEEAGLEWVAILLVIGGVGTALSIPFKLGYFVFIRKDKEVEIEKKLPVNMSIAAVAGACCCILFGVVPKIMTGLMPYRVDYHIYSAPHVLEYVQLVPAALIAFMLFLKIMEPHSALTMDFDWFARKPFKAFIMAFSRFFIFITGKWEDMFKAFYHYCRFIAQNPYKIIRKNTITDKVMKNLGAYSEFESSVDADEAHRVYNEDQYRANIGEGMAGVLIMILIITVFLMARSLK